MVLITCSVHVMPCSNLEGLALRVSTDGQAADMGTKPETTKPKRSRSFGQITKLKPLIFESTKLKAKAFSKHEAEAEAQVLPSYHKYLFFFILD